MTSQRIDVLSLPARLAVTVIPVAVLIAVLPLDALAGKGDRDKRADRTVTAEYQSPAVMPPVGSGGLYACAEGGTAGNLGCVTLPIKPTEKYLELTIEDISGLPAPVHVYEGTSSDPIVVCGKTDTSVRITPGVAIEIWIKGFSVDPLCPGVATTGTLTATLSNKK